MAKAVVFKPTSQVLDKVEIPRYFDDTQQFLNKKYVLKTSASNVGATIILYTVPAGRIFVLLGAFYNAIGDNASGLGEGSIDTNNTDMPFLLKVPGKTPTAGETQKQGIDLNYGQGIVFFGGTTFTMYNGSNPSHTAGIYGYELPITFK